MDSLPPMKQLYLEITKYRKKYRVHLGNGNWLTFNNKTEANNFLRKYKRVIRDNVSILNITQPTINQVFRNSYFQFSERDINYYHGLFHSYDDRFKYIFKRFSPGNSNAFIFQNINTCYHILIEIVESLHSFGQRGKNYGITNITKPLLLQLNQQLQSLEADKRSMYLNGSRSVKTLNTTSNESTNTKQSVGN